jgi:hypothetical protein
LVFTDEQFAYNQFQKSSCLSEDKRASIQSHLQDQIRLLKQRNLISESSSRDATLLDWPLKSAKGFEGYNYHTISNFVDHNLDFPNLVKDYNCGTRSYDTPMGYNHAGTDFALWPKPWELMENNIVEVVAAEAGTILEKSDGHFDKSCSLNNPDDWNAIYILHSDGTSAWYGHLKSNSLTPKNVGSKVARGEFLGIVGSSGASTAPHLHFELHNEEGAIIDPFAGNCSNENESTWWKDQRTYYDSGINLLEVTHVLPEDSFCSEPESEKDTTTFCGNEELFFISYLRDQISNQILYHTILKPDNSTFEEWESKSPGNQNDHFAASSMYRSFILPENPQPGEWRYNVSYQDKNYTQTFNICSPTLPSNIQAIQLQNIFPNPTRFTLKVMLKIQEEKSLQIEVMDLFGHSIHSETKFYNIGQHEAKVPVRHLEKGVYIISIKSLDTSIPPILMRFIKQ